MNFSLSAVCVFFLLMTGLPAGSMASEPADRIITNALADLDRYQAQASALTPGRSANASRILKLMNLSHERLESYPNKSDPSWIEVNDGYLALQKQLENLMNPSAADASVAVPAAPPTTVSAPSTAAPAQAPDALPGAAAPAPVSGASSSASGSAPELVSGQRVQLKKLTRDLASSRASIVTTGPSHFQDPGNLAARQKGLKQYADALERYPQVNDPDVQAARAEYQLYLEALNSEFERAKAQLAQIGDVQAALTLLQQNNQSYPIPAPLQIPFTQEQATQWAQAASSARTVAEHNSAQLNIIAPLAYLPDNTGTPESGAPFDAGDVGRMQNYAADSINRLQANYDAMATQLLNQMEGMENDVLQRWQEDPSDEEKQWLYIGEGQGEEAALVYQQSREVVNSSIYLEQALGRDAGNAADMLKRLDEAEETFKKNQKIALENSRLPELVSSNPEMMKIAEDILSSPRYEFGDYGDIIIRSKEFDEREREDSEIELDDADLSLSGELTLSGTETTWTYKWKEFKFATPIKESDSDEWYIWWITAKNFSSGGARTPLNKWISGETTKGNRILEKNL